MYPLAPPEWVTKPEDSQLEEGLPGYLHCHTRATPQPEVTWYRNFIPITAEVCVLILLRRSGNIH